MDKTKMVKNFITDLYDFCLNNGNHVVYFHNNPKFDFKMYINELDACFDFNILIHDNDNNQCLPSRM